MVGLVGLVGQNQPDLSKLSVLKQESEADAVSRLVRPNVRPKERQKELIQDNSGGYGDSASEADQEKKPRRKPSFPELYVVDPIGIEPTTSTLPV